MNAATTEITPMIQHFLSSSRKMLIAGKWVDALSEHTFPTFNPATGDVLCQVPDGQKEDIDRTVKAARYAFEQGPWRTLTPSERGKLLWKLADLMEQRTEDFAQLESLDNGKPVTLARGGDVPMAIDLYPLHGGLVHENRRAPRFRFPSRMRRELSSMRTPYGNPSVWSSDRLFPGTFRC